MLETKYSGRNIGDIFYTLRRDKESLNGAVPCEGKVFNSVDFTNVDPENNPYLLCVNGILPSLSFLDYEKEVALHGSCTCFGLDTASGSFRVPFIKDVYIQAGDLDSLGSYLAQQLPNFKGSFWSAAKNSATGIVKATSVSGDYFDRSSGGGTGQSGIYEVDASFYDPATYVEGGSVRPNSVVLRPMIQLVIPESYASDDDDDPTTPDVRLRVPYIHVPGTPAKATEVNANFEYVIRNLKSVVQNPNYVDLSQDQTIEGSKKFSQNVVAPGLSLIPEEGSVHGGLIDFHYGGSAYKTARIAETSEGHLSINKNPEPSDSSLNIATTQWVQSEITSGIESAKEFSVGSFVELETPYTLAKGITSLSEVLPKDEYQYLLWIETGSNATGVATDLTGDVDAKTYTMTIVRCSVVPIGAYDYISPDTCRRIYLHSYAGKLLGYMRIGKDAQ